MLPEDETQETSELTESENERFSLFEQEEVMMMSGESNNNDGSSHQHDCIAPVVPNEVCNSENDQKCSEITDLQNFQEFDNLSEGTILKMLTTTISIALDNT